MEFKVGDVVEVRNPDFDDNGGGWHVGVVTGLGCVIDKVGSKIFGKRSK